MPTATLHAPAARPFLPSATRRKTALPAFQGMQPNVLQPTGRPASPGGEFSQALRAMHPSLIGTPLFGGSRRKPTGLDFSPISGANIEFDKVRYPVVISPKIDGNRGLVRNGKVLGRSMTPIPNQLVQEILARPELEGMDGELIASAPTDPAALRKANSFLRSKTPKGKTFQFHVFDLWSEGDKPFSERIRLLKQRIDALPGELKKVVKLIPQIVVHNEADLLRHEKEWLKAGYEGLIARKPDAPYLQTKSTMNDQAFMKLKRFLDAEAQIIGFRPLDPNSEMAKSMLEEGELTPAQMDSLKAGAQALGGYEVRNMQGVEFRLGAGKLTFQQRETLWKNRAHLDGRIVRYKYFPVGMEEGGKPRHPTFLGFREAHDMPADVQPIAARFTKPDPQNDE